MKYAMLAVGLFGLIVGGVILEDLAVDAVWKPPDQKDTERTVEEREQQRYRDAIATNCAAIKDPRFKPAICPEQ